MKCPRCHFENPGTTRFCGNCGALVPGSKAGSPAETSTLLTPVSGLDRGSLFAGRYEVIEELGRGGMGEVYKVFDHKIKEIVALKLIKPELADRSRINERFQEELRLARKITHKNVCRMYDLGEAEGIPFITMEYVPGEDLKSMIRMMGPLSAGQAISIARQVCAGLTEAHRLGIVHQDLKPKNIMVDRDGNAKIMDFGIAHSVQEKASTGPRIMIGTPEYSSPEQAGGERGDPRSDIYSLGIILYEMVCGRVPFEGDNPLSVALKHKTETPPDPRKINPQLPESLAGLISKCLEKSREKRFQSASEVLAELKHIEEGLPTTERVSLKQKAGFLGGITEQIKRKKALSAAGILIILLVIMATSRFWPRKPGVSSPPGKPSLAVLYFSNNTGDQRLDNWKTSLCHFFIYDIRQSTRQVTVLNPESILYILNALGLEKANAYSLTDLRKIRGMGNISHIMTGYFFKAGRGLKLIYDLKEAATGMTIGSGQEDGAGEDAFDKMVPALTRNVLENLRVPSEGAEAPIPTSSSLAWKCYLEARDLETKEYLSDDPREKDSLFHQALGKLETAIREDPRFAMAYWGLGDVYQSRYVAIEEPEDYELMQKYYERAYELEPHLAGANAGLGWAYFFKEDLDKAYGYFKTALRLEPENSFIHLHVGSFLRSVGLFDQAMRHYHEAIRFGDSTLKPYNFLARCAMFLGRYEEELAHVKKMIEMEPGNLSNRLFLARALIATKKTDEAEKEIAVAEKSNPGSEYILYTRAFVYSVRGDRTKAAPILEKAKKEDPFRFTYFLAQNYAILGFKDEALEFIRNGTEVGFKRIFEYLYPYPHLLNCFFYDPLRADPRFIEILKKQKKAHEERLKKYGDL